ncbi:hypothetical protein ABMA27_001279 [Loxostege sticticalis]|uniref:Peroxidase n=1 Tax=Loxostege sticticalis TaxID=481309 RepID=A0ABR3HXX9_LOXSC
MGVSNLLSDKYSVVYIAVLLCVLVTGTSGCLDWDFLTEGLFPSLCPILSGTTSFMKDLFTAESKHDEGPITKELVTECVKCGRELTKSASQRGKQLVKNGVCLDHCTPAMHHFFSASLPADVKKASEASQEILMATKMLQVKLCSSSTVTPNTFMSFLENQVIRHDSIACRPFSVRCGSTRYRSIDGTCNNLERPAWGRRGAPFTRIATPRYADGIYSMPGAKSGRALPNPRLLSTRLFTDAPVPSRVHNYLSMQWGQFVTHDMSLQIMEVTDDGGIQCCIGDGVDVLPPEWQNDKCIPISVPEDDPFYRYFGVKCLNFVRSITTPRDDCSLGHAEQMNTVTSFLDGSTIYGSDKKLASKLRSKRGGRLKEEYKEYNKRGFLPTADDKKASCDLRNVSEPCYLAGDGRINQTPTLAMLHTLFLREHNRVADILSTLNPLWTDEKLYQEARRIVIAEIQHITYQEWLPLNFGETYLRYYRIIPSTLYSNDYNEDVNPGVINSFSSAAFRFLHSAVPDTIMTCPSNYYAAYTHRLSDHYQNPSLLESSTESFDDVVRGILLQSAAESDPYCSGQISNLLFKSRNAWGLDLIAMDIQRGRDHGIASYNDYREICGLRRAYTFQDLSGEISQDRIYALSQMYECVDDVDLFVGGSMERAVQGSILGHTFQCIVGEQFYRTRVGDRFFYDNSEMIHSFSPEQLQQLKKASIARLICDNTEHVHYVQSRAFELETQWNPKVRCDDTGAVPRVDFTAWKSSLFD